MEILVEPPPSGQKLNEDVLAWYLKTSKLALALAVISDTPPEKSSREYAEHLAKTLSVKEVDWKVKAETWKAEVLHLRQELFLSRMKSIAGTSNGADSAFCPEFPTRGALESRNESTHLEDSGCDISNGQESDTQDLLANHSLGYHDSYSLTSEKSKVLVSSALLHPESNSTRRDKLEEEEKMLNFQTEFLQSLIRIRKVAMVRMPSTEALILDSDHSVVTDSVSLLAKNLLAFCVESRSLLPDSLLMETTWTLVHLLHDGKLPKIILVQCIKIVEELVKDLVKVILDNTKVNRVSTFCAVCYSYICIYSTNNCSLTIVYGFSHHCLRTSGAAYIQRHKFHYKDFCIPLSGAILISLFEMDL
ncbi:meiosis-specific protein MEI4-like [Chiloscyllium plagiosum]|uniref:meiosis-specific protein MEI4-like n=1 Tax=Chiloscyllium plagiosum TaxID=36176 RepID=UPI001CB7B698|nr:meiosis-specific protein MEI4-like [Chiloscyllium plagiosum]